MRAAEHIRERLMDRAAAVCGIAGPPPPYGPARRRACGAEASRGLKPAPQTGLRRTRSVL